MEAWQPGPGHKPTPKPVYLNEDKLPDPPEKLWVSLRKGLRESRYRRIVEQLPPQRSRAELRKSCRCSQEQLARILSVTQARISRIERCPNPRIHLLRTYVEALGGTLHLLVRFPTRDLRITL